MSTLRRKKPPNLARHEIAQAISDIHYYGVCWQTREIYLMSHHGEVTDEDPGVDFRSAGTFLRNIRLLDHLGRSKITVHMQIIGGSWPDGMAIFDAIRASKSTVHAYAYAQASSMSGVILQAANWRVMMPSTHFMIHHGWVDVSNTASAGSEEVRFNDRECQKMVQIYAERAVNGPFFKSKRWGAARVADFINQQIKDKGDWYMTAEEAVEYGFADEVFTGRF